MKTDAIEQAIDAYIEDYTLEADEGSHSPGEAERFMLKDAMLGLLADPAFKAAFASAPEAPASVSEPAVAWMWQHEETGHTGFVDVWQIANGWQESNPRLKLIRPLVFAAAQKAPVSVSGAWGGDPSVQDYSSTVAAAQEDQ